MLFALGQPEIFAGLLLGFLMSVVLHGWAQAVMARVLGDRWSLRRAGKIKERFDPFGAVAAGVGGPGWGKETQFTLSQPSRQVVALLAGPIAVGLLAVAGFAMFLAAGGTRSVLGEVELSDLLRRDVDGPRDQLFFFSFGMEALIIAVLSLIPLPPLTGWRLAVLFSTNSVGWQKARYWLEEKNIGLGILLVLLILPLGVGGPLLLSILDEIASLILDLAT